jgi:alkyl sulfatase BDS1-like metallo-beta-lactamase superfamily hydrolase
MLLDYMAVRLNGPRAGKVRPRINLRITDTDAGAACERYLLTVENGVLRHAPNEHDDDDDTLHISRTGLRELAVAPTTVDLLLARQAAVVEGQRADLDELLGLLDTFTGAFELVAPNLR